MLDKDATTRPTPTEILNMIQKTAPLVLQGTPISTEKMDIEIISEDSDGFGDWGDDDEIEVVPELNKA